MKKLLIVGPLMIVLSTAAQSQKPEQAAAQSSRAQSNPPANANSDKTPAKRVRADLSGFELAPKKPTTTSKVQIGGGTRGVLPGPHPYAPRRARCYTTNPIFYWGQRDLHNDFKFTLYDSDDHVFYESLIHGKSFTYPSGATPLHPGSTYSWTVQIAGPVVAEPTEPAEVVVQSLPERQAIQNSLVSITGDSLQDQLRRARVFVDARLWYDAIATYSELIAKYPDQANLYEKRGEIYDQIPETRELAGQDFARAENLRTGTNTEK